MLRRIIVVLLTIIGLVVINTAEPVYKRYPASVIHDNKVTIDCADDNEDSPQCRTLFNNVNNDTSINEKIGNDITDDDKSWNFADLFDDSVGDEARGKKKKKGFGKYVIVMAAAAKATLMYVMIHAVAILAAKALLVAKVALALAATVALKKALEHNDKTSYEIVKHPQHSYVQSHSSSVDYDHGGYDGHRRRRRSARR